MRQSSKLIAGRELMGQVETRQPPHLIMIMSERDGRSFIPLAAK